MDVKLFLTVFATVFIAELGDKTQLATMLFSAREQSGRMTVFLAAAGALTVSAGLGVLAGGVISRFMSEKTLSLIAGVGFIAIGLWTLWRR